jgi:hypothetical protein
MRVAHSPHRTEYHLAFERGVPRPVGQFWTAECCDLPDDDNGVGVIQAAGSLEQVCVYVPGGMLRIPADSVH